MKTQGVNLGQLQLQLLKKVEELTLYVIQQDGIVDKQKTVIAELQQTNENQRAAIATLLSRVEAIEHAHAASK
jgi:hypothetical protein